MVPERVRISAAGPRGGVRNEHAISPARGQVRLIDRLARTLGSHVLPAGPLQWR